jgi:S1-C subfamily serine protease
MQLRVVEHSRPTLGFSTERDANGAVNVQAVIAEGPAAEAGLRAGDTILTWNGAEPPRRLERWLREQKAGDVLKLKVRREEKEVTIEVRLGEIKETFYGVSEDSHASEKARRIRDGLLHGVTSAVTVPVH